MRTGGIRERAECVPIATLRHPHLAEVDRGVSRLPALEEALDRGVQRDRVQLAREECPVPANGRLLVMPALAASAASQNPGLAVAAALWPALARFWPAPGQLTAWQGRAGAAGGEDESALASQVRAEFHFWPARQ